MKRLQKLSRRDFIKLTGGVAAVAAVGGCIDGIIPETDVRLVTRTPSEMVEELGMGSIDGFMAWEPFNAEAAVAGYGNIIIESGEIWENHPCCVMAYGKEWLDQDVDDRENILKRLAWSQVKATRWINNALDEDSEEHEELLELAQSFTDRDMEVVEKAFGPIKFDYDLNKEGTEQYINDLVEYQIFDLSRWDEVGYEDAEEYAEDILEKDYVEWAIENIDLSIEDVVEETGGALDYEINVGYLEYDLHQLSYIVSAEKGWFDDLGLSVETKEYPNGAELMRNGFGDNDIDVGYLGTTPALIHRVNTPGCEIGIFAGVNAEGSAIVAKEGIDEVEDFADIEDAVYATPGEGTMQEFMSIRVFDDAGLTL
ncbi:ABC-type nitrate/sulfonate/bicarbonate transport system periplasmic component [Methanonatronarchaeum thermophilum]|uniref:ABC-type nitrate/sulfonate/bicarbonate transport system periplasmic component n=1 Tax=Methanonatronarchaeum thermophilum TaxID=1927129 RepID=A0A1Y3GC48_9EURY|nr:ABC transporter substrate-binding protein [Methanonatronarchaeum thermophilum]OUJ18989.1 ABC-type nitrate/sulfonate/bicarbonate transport system periplasmic component [Methanonatronarchaeum thermophilum]